MKKIMKWIHNLFYFRTTTSDFKILSDVDAWQVDGQAILSDWPKVCKWRCYE